MLQSPVVRFENPHTGRSVTVVATSHTGSAGYYEQLRAVINKIESGGAVVCLEGVGSASEQELAAASDEERAALGRYQASRAPASDLSLAACRYLGWVDQTAALGSSPTWRNADMTKLELVRRAGPRNLLSLHVPGDEFTRMTHDRQEALAAGGYAIVVRLAQYGWMFDPFRSLLVRLVGDAHRRLEHVEVEGRNGHVLASLPPESDAVLPWGAGHMRGLAQGLRQAGYRRRETTWVTVGILPPTWLSIRLLSTGLRALWVALDEHDDSAESSRPESAT